MRDKHRYNRSLDRSNDHLQFAQILHIESKQSGAREYCFFQTPQMIEMTGRSCLYYSGKTHRPGKYGERKIGEPYAWTTVTNQWPIISAVTASSQEPPVDRHLLCQKRNSIRHQRETHAVYCLTAFCLNSVWNPKKDSGQGFSLL